MSVKIVEREVTKTELDRINEGFDEHGIEHGVPPYQEVRYSYVAMDGDRVIGSASGLAYRHWFYITDLWLEKEYRRRGMGLELLQKLEAKVLVQGVRNMWTWTAGYEAPAFYKKAGYEVFCELEEYYPTGHSRVGFKKRIKS